MKRHAATKQLRRAKENGCNAKRRSVRKSKIPERQMREAYGKLLIARGKYQVARIAAERAEAVAERYRKECLYYFGRSLIRKDWEQKWEKETA